jgi:galactokinase
MAQPIPTLDSLLKQAQNLFKAEYGITPTHCAVAPGRVNLIGEHTDYNEGLVLPMALPLVTVAVGRMTKTGLCRIITNDSGGKESNKVTDIKISKLTPGPPL